MIKSFIFAQYNEELTVRDYLAGNNPEKKKYNVIKDNVFVCSFPRKFISVKMRLTEHIMRT